MRLCWLLLAVLAACDAESRAASAPPPPPPAPAPAATAAAAAPAPAAPQPPAQHKVDVACGSTGQVDCPLQAWMKANLQAAVRGKDFEQVRRGMERLRQLEPPSMPEWGSIVKDGLAAADAKDAGALREACGHCHETYRARYRGEMRDLPLAKLEMKP